MLPPRPAIRSPPSSTMRPSTLIQPSGPGAGGSMKPRGGAQVVSSGRSSGSWLPGTYSSGTLSRVTRYSRYSKGRSPQLSTRSGSSAGAVSPYSDSSTSSATARIFVASGRPLDALEAERGPCLVDGDERHRLVALDRGDLSKNIAAHPPRRRREVGRSG